VSSLELIKNRDHSKLKGRIREKDESYRSIAAKLSMSATTLSNKINGHTTFNADEIAKLIDILEIEESEIANYFFN